jgi:ABC-type transport system substrate-binding protein
MQGGVDQTVSRIAIETLVRLDSTGNIVPWLAESIESDPVALTITITLKKGIKFHDGTDFNAAAAKWNIDLTGSSPSNKPYFVNVNSLDVIDNYTIQFKLKQWDNALIQTLTMAPGYMISPTAYQKNGADWCKGHPVGTGSFKFVSWQRDVKTVYERNDNYWIPGKPYLDGLETYVIPDPTVAQASLIKGDIDIYAQTPPQQATELQEKGFIVASPTCGGAARMMIGDSANPDSPFANLKVRQAMWHAIDQQAIVDSVWRGLVLKGTQYAQPNTWPYNPDVVGYPFDPNKARQLLAEAGYPHGFDTTIYCLNQPALVNTFTAAQGYLGDVGIKANLVTLDMAKYVDMYTNTGWTKGGIFCLGWLVDSYPLALMAGLFRSDVKMAVGKAMLDSAEIDKLFDDTRAAPDFASKQKLYWQLQSVLIDKYCLFFPVIIYLEHATKNPKVHGDSLDDPQGSTGLWTPEDAWIEK